MSSVNDYNKKLNSWLDSLSDMQKYGLIGMFLGIVLLILAIILW